MNTLVIPLGKLSLGQLLDSCLNTAQNCDLMTLCGGKGLTMTGQVT